jgi:hypothetical protein
MRPQKQPPLPVSGLARTFDTRRGRVYLSPAQLAAVDTTPTDEHAWFVSQMRACGDNRWRQADIMAATLGRLGFDVSTYTGNGAA